MPDQIKGTPFEVVYQGLWVALPSDEGERRFVQLAFGTQEGTEVSYYDTRGMTIDAANHIRAAARITGYLAHDEVSAFLVEQGGLELSAKASGRDIEVEFGNLGIELKEGGNKVAGLTFPERGGCMVEVVRSSDGASVRGRWPAMDWDDAADILGGYGYDLTATIQAPAPAHRTL